MNKANHCLIDINKPGLQLKLDFALPVQQVLGIYGPSGCGKTTLLRSLAGLDRHPNNQVCINGKTYQDYKTFVPTEQRNLALMFQDLQLFPHMTVSENLAFAVDRRTTTDPQLDVAEVAAALDIGFLLQRLPRQLSGGEKQRVSLARAVLQQPQLLLLDEPLAALDSAHKLSLLNYLRTIHKRFKLPMVFVSHQITELIWVCDELMAIEAGRSVFNGPINEAMINPQTGLLSDPENASVLACLVVGVEPEHGLLKVQTQGGVDLWVKGEAEVGNEGRVVIAANEVSLSTDKPQASSILNVIDGEIMAIKASGGFDALVVVGEKDETIVARISNKSLAQMNLEIGTQIYLQFKAQAINLII